MAINRDRKVELVETYAEGLVKAPHVVLMSFEGITVPQVTELREKVRTQGGSYIVVKNRLVARVIEGQALEGLQDQFRGATAAVYGSEDAVAMAKAVTEFAKDVPALEIKGGLLDGAEVKAEDIAELASLPSRDELLAKLLYLLQSPVTSFVRTLNELPRQFVSVLDQIRAARGAGEKES